MNESTTPTITIGDYEAHAHIGDRLVGTTDTLGPRLENSDRYVAYVIYGDCCEELDIDVVRDIFPNRGIARQLATAAAEAGLQPGWDDIVLEGPKVGLY